MNARSFDDVSFNGRAFSGHSSNDRCLWRIRDRAGARWNPRRRWRTLWWHMTEMQAQVWAAKHGFEIERVERTEKRAEAA